MASDFTDDGRSSTRCAAATKPRSLGCSTSTTRPCTAPPGCTWPPTRTPTRSCRRPGSPCSGASTASSSRSSLKTWLYRILMNIARTRGVKESRTIPFSSAAGALTDGAEPTFDADRFRPPDRPGLARTLGVVPARLGAPTRIASARRRDARRWSRAIIEQLPPAQTRGAHAARRRRLDVDRGLSCPRVDRDQPTGTAPPRARQGPACARVLLRRQPCVMTPPVDDFPCNVFVELVTEYLEGALSSDETRRLEEHLAHLRRMRERARAVPRGHPHERRTRRGRRRWAHIHPARTGHNRVPRMGVERATEGQQNRPRSGSDTLGYIPIGQPREEQACRVHSKDCGSST